MLFALAIPMKHFVRTTQFYRHHMTSPVFFFQNSEKTITIAYDSVHAPLFIFCHFFFLGGGGGGTFLNQLIKPFSLARGQWRENSIQR